VLPVDLATFPVLFAGDDFFRVPLGELLAGLERVDRLGLLMLTEQENLEVSRKADDTV
jgi:hypothetical protein